MSISGPALSDRRLWRYAAQLCRAGFALTLAATVGLADERTGNAARLEKTRWTALNIPQGGPALIYERAGTGVWGNSYAPIPSSIFCCSIPRRESCRPAPIAADQVRHAFIGRILARTDWSAKIDLVHLSLQLESINHQSGDCGQFELYARDSG